MITLTKQNDDFFLLLNPYLETFLTSYVKQGDLHSLYALRAGIGMNPN